MTYVLIDDDPKACDAAQNQFPGVEWAPPAPDIAPDGQRPNRIILRHGQSDPEWAWHMTDPSDATLFSWFRGIPEGPLVPSDIMRATDVRYLQPLLYFLARGMHARTAVEIGVADGSTTWPLLKAVSEAGGCLYSVDPDPCLLAHDMVQRTGRGAHWQFVQAQSDAFFQWSGAPADIDIAFIDGDHTTDAVLNDAHNVLSRLVPGGIAIFHEWTPGTLSYEEMVHQARVYDGPAHTRLGIHGTPRALYQALPQYDVDVFPLAWGACGLERYPEWTEPGAVMIRKRKGETILTEIAQQRGRTA